CLGAEILNLIPVAGTPVVFVNVSVLSCDDPGENVWSPGGLAVAAAGDKLSRCRSYSAATTLACTSWSVASEGNVPAAVIAPSSKVPCEPLLLSPPLPRRIAPCLRIGS